MRKIKNVASEYKTRTRLVLKDTKVTTGEPREKRRRRRFIETGNFNVRGYVKVT